MTGFIVRYVVAHSSVHNAYWCVIMTCLNSKKEQYVKGNLQTRLIYDFWYYITALICLLNLALGSLTEQQAYAEPWSKL